MAKSEIEKRAQTAEDIFGQIQGYLLSKIPMGNELNLLFNARNNIRKDRLMRFFESFREELQRVYGKPLDSDEITSEEFIDVMEAIMIRVQNTKSTYKIERFRNILIQQAIHPIEEQRTLKYISIVDDLTDIQLRILEVANRYYTKRIQVSELNSLLHGDSNRPLERSNTIHIPIGGNEIATTTKEIGFYFDELMRIGLIEYLTEEPLNLPSGYSATQYIPITYQRNTKIMVDRVVTITALGNALVNFVKSID